MKTQLASVSLDHGPWYDLATYFSQMLTTHENKLERCSSCAGIITCWLQER